MVPSPLFQIKANIGPRVWWKIEEPQNPNRFNSSVRVPQSVMLLGTSSSRGDGPLFSEVNSQCNIYWEILEHFAALCFRGFLLFH